MKGFVRKKRRGIMTATLKGLVGMIMTLCDAGFSEAEIEQYMNFCKNGKSEPEKCISMLENKRRGTLEEIHRKERQIENIDCLKYKLKAEVMKNE